MDAVVYLIEKERMLSSIGKKIDNCHACKCTDNDCALYVGGKCIESDTRYFSKAVSIIEKWTKDNPPKTKMEDFRLKCPNVRLNPINKTPMVCCDLLGYETDCIDDCCFCWKKYGIKKVIKD